MTTENSSQISKFYKKPIQERQEVVENWIGNDVDIKTPLSLEQADNMIENVIGLYGLPFAVATNFLINDKDYLIPIVIEEPSVVAAVSFAAKLFRDGGGFTTSSDNPEMIGQIQILNCPNINTAIKEITQEKESLLQEINKIGGSIIKRGGGARDLEIRVFDTEQLGQIIILHLIYDCRDAMGANAINTAVELIAPKIETLTSGRVNLRILSNLTDRRKARAEGIIPAESLATGNLSGEEVLQSIIEAGVFAEIDPYRATTHNKGIMNGIDSVIIATGNDWRAVEAGAHAFAARSGTYTSLTKWRRDADGNLRGSIELPLAVGIVGGATRVHPMAQSALKILGVTSAQELSEVIAAVGLAQNFAAIRALATDGIQKGHMRMHARQLAAAAGAPLEAIPTLVEIMIREGNIRLERATQLLENWYKEQ